ncbi:hypothetical protein KCP74_21625 [Salmonella enterica subsp. enterica]|nr:hypothetical protein KCP74_21625 [Salmonella enterica subsp. enterica]
MPVLPGHVILGEVALSGMFALPHTLITMQLRVLTLLFSCGDICRQQASSGRETSCPPRRRDSRHYCHRSYDHSLWANHPFARKAALSCCRDCPVWPVPREVCWQTGDDAEGQSGTRTAKAVLIASVTR